MEIGELPDAEVEAALAAAGVATADTTGWVADPLVETAVVSATAGVWRIHADGWSVVVKRLQLSASGNDRWQAGADPGHWLYWRREALAFDSDVLTLLTGGIRSPSCYGVFDRDDGTVDVWLEDVSGSPARNWETGRFAEAARQLGVAQGTIARLGPPAEPWLSRNWLRRYLAIRRHDGDILWDKSAWNHPIVRANLPPENADRARALWNGLSRNLRLVEAFPRTLCHFDLHPDNLYDVSGDTVLIDWAFVGIGGLGEDIGALVPDFITDFHFLPSELPNLFDLLAHHYASGLRSAGIKITDDEVRQMVAVAAIAKYAWIIPALLETVTSGRPTMNGRPVPEAAGYWGGAGQFLLDLARRFAS